MTQLEYTLPPDAAPQRLNLFLRAQGLTAGLIKSVKYDGGGFFCGGASVHTDYIVHPGQTVRFALPLNRFTAFIAAVLGVPGVILLLLLQLIL